MGYREGGGTRISSHGIQGKVWVEISCNGIQGKVWDEISFHGIHGKVWDEISCHFCYMFSIHEEL